MQYLGEDVDNPSARQSFEEALGQNVEASAQSSFTQLLFGSRRGRGEFHQRAMYSGAAFEKIAQKFAGSTADIHDVLGGERESGCHLSAPDS